MYKSNEKKYRHDENVIATVPVSYRPISVLPEQQVVSNTYIYIYQIRFEMQYVYKNNIEYIFLG